MAKRSARYIKDRIKLCYVSTITSAGNSLLATDNVKNKLLIVKKLLRRNIHISNASLTKICIHFAYTECNISFS